MDIIIKRTRDSQRAYQIAESLPHYFNKHGLEEISKAVKEQILFGAFKNNEMVGFLTLKELNSEALELSWKSFSNYFFGKD